MDLSLCKEKTRIHASAPTRAHTLHAVLLSFVHDLLDCLQQVLFAVALCHLLLWSQATVVSAALRLQVAAAVQVAADAIEDDGERARQQAAVTFGTCEQVSVEVKQILQDSR